MAFKHGAKASVTINTKDLSAYCDDLSLGIDVDTADTTTFASTWKSAIEGLAGATLEISGAYDPTATTGPAAVLTGLIGAGAVACVVAPSGTATNDLKRTFNAILTNYTEASPVGGRVNFSASMLVTGAITFGAY
jgi:hypothetical protein